MKRLAIIVPYRAREAHLKVFVPTLQTYFTRDKLDCKIPYRVIVVEQGDDLPFNRGALNNIGFSQSCADADYVCFHDIDYVPIWADYSWSDVPACIVWYGADQRAIAPGRSNMVIKENPERYFGGVVLMPNSIFAQVNGYANSYWGWGPEDADLRDRLTTSGIEVGRRKGTFQSLDHDSRGYRLDGELTPKLTPKALANHRIWLSRWSIGANNEMQSDGLKTLSYEVVNRQPIPNALEQRSALWEKITVRLLMHPSREQLEAPGW